MNERTIERLKPRQQIVAALLASGMGISEAARACKVGRTTIHGWLHQPAFRAEVERATQAVARQHEDAACRTYAEAIQAVAERIREGDLQTMRVMLSVWPTSSS